MKFSKKAEQKDTLVPLQTQCKLDDVLAGVKDGSISPKIAHAYKKEFSKAQSSYYQNKNHTFKARLNLNMAMDAYLFALENGATPDEALSHTQRIHDLTDEFIKEAKNNLYGGSRTSYKVVKKHDKHPVQRSLKKDGVMDRGSLTSAKTPNQQLSRLHRYIILQEQINTLTEANKLLQFKSDLLEVIASTNCLVENKGKVCKGLHKRGYTYTDLAKHYGVTHRTIKRWIDNENL